MLLLIVRHAHAGDSAAWSAAGRPDSDRPLSDKGRDQMRGVTKALRTLVPDCTLVITSPYTRARQTAELLAAAWPGVPVEIAEALEPGGRPEQVAAALSSKRGAKVAAVVGHEPDLGVLATWCLCGRDHSRIEFKKAGAGLVEFEGPIRGGEGVLRWLMGPRQLAAL